MRLASNSSRSPLTALNCSNLVKVLHQRRFSRGYLRKAPSLQTSWWISTTAPWRFSVSTVWHCGKRTAWHRRRWWICPTHPWSITSFYWRHLQEALWISITNDSYHPAYSPIALLPSGSEPPGSGTVFSPSAHSLTPSWTDLPQKIVT